MDLEPCYWYNSQMTELLQPNKEYCEVFGNKDIKTPFGLLNIDVHPQSLRQELINITEIYHPKNTQAQNTGRERAGNLVFVFGGVPLKDVLLPRFDKALTERGLSEVNKNRALEEYNDHFESYNLKTASSFVNPTNDQEYILYINLPFLIQDRGLNNYDDFVENFRRVWIHERFHFAQSADTDAFMGRMAQDSSLIDNLVIIYFLSLPAVGFRFGLEAMEKAIRFIDEQKHKKITRREFLQLLGGVVGLTAGALIAGNTYGKVGHNLQYKILPTVESEAEDIVQKTDYNKNDLQQSFQFNLS